MLDVKAEFTDEELMLEVCRGDRPAFERLYDRHAGLVYGMARRLLRDEGQCEELVQEVFLTVWQRSGSFDPERAKFVTWVVTTTRNRAIDQLRREQSRPQRADVDDFEALPLADERAEIDPSHMASEHERAARIRVTLELLPDAQRRAIELAYFSGLTQTEIAAKLGEPVGTIKTRMFHGMRKLRDLLEDAGVRNA